MEAHVAFRMGKEKNVGISSGGGGRIVGLTAN